MADAPTFLRRSRSGWGCLGCRGWVRTSDGLCGRCWVAMEPVAPRRLAGGMLVYPAARHAGVSRRLIHLLKYHGVVDAAATLARGMAPLVPHLATTLVPVPRARPRRWRYGVDPGLELAKATAARGGWSVHRGLWAPWWSARHAGKARSRRAEPAFSVRAEPVGEAVLVDDVLTTGATLGAAQRAFRAGPRTAVTASAAVYGELEPRNGEP